MINERDEKILEFLRDHAGHAIGFQMKDRGSLWQGMFRQTAECSFARGIDIVNEGVKSAYCCGSSVGR